MPALRRPPCRGLALLALCAIGLTGCQTHVAAAPAQPSTSPASTEPLESVPTSLPSTLAQRVVPAPIVNTQQAAPLISAPWKLFAISRDQRTLTIWANQGGSCDKPGGIHIAQSAGEVELTSVYAQGQPSTGTSCLAYLDAPLWAVRLEHPLGHRALIHAPATGSVP